MSPVASLPLPLLLIPSQLVYPLEDSFLIYSGQAAAVLEYSLLLFLAKA